MIMLLLILYLLSHSINFKCSFLKFDFVFDFLSTEET